MEDDGTANRSAAEREALAVLTAMSQINARSTSQRLPPSRPASRASSTDAPPPKPSPSPSPAPSPPPTTTPSHRPHRGVARPWVPPPVPDPPAEALKRLKPYICSYLACDARYDTVLESLEHEKDCLRRLDGARQVNTFSCLEEPSGCRIRFNDYAKMLDHTWVHYGHDVGRPFLQYANPPASPTRDLTNRFERIAVAAVGTQRATPATPACVNAPSPSPRATPSFAQAGPSAGAIDLAAPPNMAEIRRASSVDAGKRAREASAGAARKSAKTTRQPAPSAITETKDHSPGTDARQELKKMMAQAGLSRGPQPEFTGPVVVPTGFVNAVTPMPTPRPRQPSVELISPSVSPILPDIQSFPPRASTPAPVNLPPRRKPSRPTSNAPRPNSTLVSPPSHRPPPSLSHLAAPLSAPIVRSLSSNNVRGFYTPSDRQLMPPPSLPLRRAVSDPPPTRQLTPHRFAPSYSTTFAESSMRGSAGPASLAAYALSSSSSSAARTVVGAVQRQERRVDQGEREADRRPRMR